MSNPLLAKYMARELAAETSQALNLRPPLLWQQVMDYLEPPMVPRENYNPHKYDQHTRALIEKHLQREFARLHLWRNPPVTGRARQW